MRHQSILEFARFRWLKWSLLLVAICSVAYLGHEPPVKPYGGSWLGYTLGTVGALLILWLLYYGVRKRRYASRVGTVQGWLSAHVYLGTALIVVATLHSGFELGWNVHTLAYVLMLLVVVSGFYGVYMYLRVPRLMTDNLGEESIDSLLLHIADADRELREKSISLPDQPLAAVDRSLRESRLGGSFLRLVSGRDRRCPTRAAVQAWPELTRGIEGDAGKLAKDVFALLLQKDQMLERGRRQLRHQAMLELWLFVHVPLAVMLLAALAAHVVSVFIYW